MFKTLRRKLRNFKFYRQILEANKEVLETEYNVRIDSIWRIYTIYTITPEDYYTYGGRKKAHEHSEGGALMNGDELFEKNVKQKISKLDGYLRSIGLSELYGLAEKKRVDAWNYKIVIRYKEIDTLFWANVFMYSSLAILAGLSAGTVLLLF